MEKETITLRCGSIIKKITIPEVYEFSILLFTQNRKLKNLGKFSFTSIFAAIWNSKSKNRKSDLEEITLTLRCGLRRKNAYFRSFQVFDFSPILEIENLETPESFCLLQIFIVSVTLSMRKVKIFHWISN